MTTDKQEMQRLAKLHDAYCNGYHTLPRAVKRQLSLHDMQEIWHHMVKLLLEELLAELAAVTAERDKLVEALKLADAALSGANMNMKAVEKAVRAALPAPPEDQG